MIEVVNFKKNYGKSKAIKDISFHVKKGLITGFVGKNGAGKSTTIHALLNLIKPTSGKLTIDGLDSIKDSRKIKEIISYIPSDIVYYKNIEIIDLFKFACKIQETNFEEALDLAKYFELDVKKKFNELSLGNKKKVSLVLSLMKEAKLYIFDEPTSGLDPLVQEKFFQKILEKKQKGATIFLSSHNLGEIEKYSDQVIIIKGGKIVDVINLKEEAKFEKLEVRYTLKEGKQVKEIFSGDINNLIDKLHQKDLISLEIKKASMEERFLKYYEVSENEK